MYKYLIYSFTALTWFGISSTSHAESGLENNIKTVQSELQKIKQEYETRIKSLETKLQKLESEKNQKSSSKKNNLSLSNPFNSKKSILSNDFNPSIGIILNGKYQNFSSDTSEITGFAIGHEGERPSEGFSVNHSELNFAANIDDKFFGSLTAALDEHEGEQEIELEEAYIETLSGIGLPDGLNIKLGRFYANIGYLNEHHDHTDDFADRPLPYRVFLNHAYNDDGIELSYVLPTELYTEIGASVFQGDDYPFGQSNGDGFSNYSAYIRLGNDIGYHQSWRLGLSYLSGKSDGGRHSNEDLLTFFGENKFYIADFRYIWAPFGNPKNQEFSLQTEFFYRKEKGIYEDADLINIANPEITGIGKINSTNSGWYVQAVYKFFPQWRIGARYSQLKGSSVPKSLTGSALDSDYYNPYNWSVMLDWTNSEFSRFRIQYTNEKTSHNREDHQFIFQYIMSIGAHSAHKY